MTQHVMPQSPPGGNRHQRRGFGARLKQSLRRVRGALNDHVPSKEELFTVLDQCVEAGVLTAQECAEWKEVDLSREEMRLATYESIWEAVKERCAEQGTRWLEQRFGPGKRLELTALGDGRESAGFTFPNDRDRMKAWIKDRNGGNNLYFGRDPRKPSWSGTSAAQTPDVGESSFAFLDFDKPEGMDDAAWQARLDELEQMGRESDAHCIIRTARGLHLHFRLVPSSDPAEMDRRKQLLNAASKAIGSDPVSDEPRIARLPFSISIPNQRKRNRGVGLALVRPTYVNADAPEHDPDALAERLSGQKIAAPVSTRAAKARVRADLVAQNNAVFRKLMSRVKNKWTDREKFVAMMHATIGAGGGTAEAFDLAEKKAAEGENADPVEDARIIRSIDPATVKTGFPHLMQELLAQSPDDFHELQQDIARAIFSPVSKEEHAQQREAWADKPAPSSGRKSKAEKALEFLDERSGLTVWADHGKEAYLRLSNGQCHAINSAAGRHAINGLLYQGGIILSENDLKQVRASLEAKARFEGEARVACMRFAWHEGASYIDAASADGRVYKIGPGGWELLTYADLEGLPFRFVQADGMLEIRLPVPPTRSFLDCIDEYFSLPKIESLDPDDAGVQAIAAILVFLAGVYSPAPGAHLPILVINGPARSGKTVTTMRLRGLLDPSTLGVMTAPRDEQQWAVVTRNMALPTFDNISVFTPGISDFLCSVSTGAVYAARQLHTNGELAKWSIRRPVILNGIEIPMRSDLSDRAVRLNLVPFTHPRDEAKAEAEWDAAVPEVFGALLDMLAKALEILPGVDLNKAPAPSPRFRHAATLGEAMARAIGWRDFLLIEALHASAQEGNQSVVMGSPLALRIARVLHGRGGKWDATPSDWLAAVTGAYGPQWGPKGPPRTPDVFSRSLTRIETALRSSGWTIDRRKTGTGADRRMHIQISAPAEAIEAANDASTF